MQEVGSNVHGFKVGDHVGIGTYVNSCRNCDYCGDGLEVFCEKGAVLTYNNVDEDGTITQGGFSSYIVAHQGQVFSTFLLKHAELVSRFLNVYIIGCFCFCFLVQTKLVA